MLIGQLLEDHRAAKPAIIFEGRAYSYAELDDLSNQFAHLFGKLRLETGDRVSMLIGNEPLVVAAYFGMFKTGVTGNPINNRLTVEETAYVLGHSGSRLLITSPEFLPLAVSAVETLDVKPAILLLGAAPGVAVPVSVLSDAELFAQPRAPRRVEGRGRRRFC